MVAGVGLEPHDLRVMSPTSYQAALPRDIYSLECLYIIHARKENVNTFKKDFFDINSSHRNMAVFCFSKRSFINNNGWKILKFYDIISFVNTILTEVVLW